MPQRHHRSGRWQRAAAGPVLAALLAAAPACQPRSIRCVVAANCPQEQICVDSRCASPCTGDSDCSSGTRCLGGGCLITGDRCASDDNCLSFETCVADRCRRVCIEQRDCASGQVCRGGRCWPLETLPDASQTDIGATDGRLTDRSAADSSRPDSGSGDVSIDDVGSPDAATGQDQCTTRTYYFDADNDGHGISAPAPRELCAAEGEWRALVGDDCNDEVAAVNPDAIEVCDGIDNDCNDATAEINVQCAANWLCCGAAGCIDPQLDPLHCGDCNASCNGHGSCSGAVCVCNTGFAGAKCELCDLANNYYNYPDCVIDPPGGSCACQLESYPGYLFCNDTICRNDANHATNCTGCGIPENRRCECRSCLADPDCSDAVCSCAG